MIEAAVLWPEGFGACGGWKFGFAVLLFWLIVIGGIHALFWLLDRMSGR